MTERKKTSKPLTWEDVREAAKAGDKVFEEWSKTQDSYICDCEKNYGKTCKYPEKYRNGGCK